jgi:transposase
MQGASASCVQGQTATSRIRACRRSPTANHENRPVRARLACDERQRLPHRNIAKQTFSAWAPASAQRHRGHRQRLLPQGRRRGAGNRGRGAELRYLPEHSPDFNSIELVFRALKALLRKRLSAQQRAGGCVRCLHSMTQTFRSRRLSTLAMIHYDRDVLSP